ncbi:helix-turn-helix domain-containing protein [Kingella oralis]|nr:helix-turn-helix domain-containing protein [Kingella oralis]
MKKTKLTDGREKENEALKGIFNKKKKELGLTQAILAEKLDVSQGAVNMYLNGINPLNTPIASRFAELLNVPVSDFSPRLAAEIGRMAQTIASTTMQVSHSTLKDRLIYAREQKGISQEQLGKAINKSQSAIAALETGRNQGSTNIAKIAEVLGVSAIWLETGQGEMYPQSTTPRINEITDIHRPILWSSNTPLPEDDYVFVPFLKETELRGGAGSFEIPDYNGFRLPFGKSTLHRKGIMPDNVICCTLTGDSMEPRIPEYATIAVDKGIERIRDGKIYAFQHDDLFRVKYLYRLPGNKVRIRSDNENYEDEIVSGEEIRVIGRVFWWSVLD